ncbi:MAG: DUF1176 domain-containing protein [Gammaproteobacteria bacterium]
MSNSSILSGITLVMPMLCAHATDLPELSFSHKDWEIVCDNTRTCRAAGYQSDQDEPAVSVLLTRHAGPNQPVTGQMMIGIYEDGSVLDQRPAELKLSMRINGRFLGDVTIRKDIDVAALSEKQVTALLAALRQDSNIEWSAGQQIWRLSDKGASAVLLKMDEFQRRIGTPGALIKKGANSESSVLPALLKPVVITAPVEKPHPGDRQWLSSHSKDLLEALRASVTDDDCMDLLNNPNETAELSIERLTGTKLLVSTQCWTGAYNIGYGYWVINDSAPYEPVLVTAIGSGYEAGKISAYQKGRGLADCISNDEWTWDGKQFIQTESSSTGMCKLVALGGTWTLPTLTMDVRYASDQ